MTPVQEAWTRLSTWTAAYERPVGPPMLGVIPSTLAADRAVVEAHVMAKHEGCRNCELIEACRAQLATARERVRELENENAALRPSAENYHRQRIAKEQAEARERELEAAKECAAALAAQMNREAELYRSGMWEAREQRATALTRLTQAEARERAVTKLLALHEECDDDIPCSILSDLRALLAPPAPAP